MSQKVNVMKIKSSFGLCFALFVVIIAIAFYSQSNETKDEWHYSDGTSIRCRVSYCDNSPVYSN